MVFFASINIIQEGGVSQTPKSIESKRRANKESIKHIMALLI